MLFVSNRSFPPTFYSFLISSIRLYLFVLIVPVTVTYVFISLELHFFIVWLLQSFFINLQHSNFEKKKNEM